jgi:hypothetical protein
VGWLAMASQDWDAGASDGSPVFGAVAQSLIIVASCSWLPPRATPGWALSLSAVESPKDRGPHLTVDARPARPGATGHMARECGCEQDGVAMTSSKSDGSTTSAVAWSALLGRSGDLRRVHTGAGQPIKTSGHV